MRISKRLLKRIAIGFGIVLGLLLIANGVLAWMAQHHLDQRIAELRAAGEPASLLDLAPKPIPPEKNAAFFLQEIEPELERFYAEYAKYYETPLGKQTIDGIEMPANGEQRSAMKSILIAYPTIQAAMEKAAACDQYASLFDFSLPPSKFLDSSIHAPLIRHLTHYISWEMEVLVDEGKSSEAVRLGVRMLRLTRLRDQEPALMNHLVSLGVRGVMFALINEALRRNEVAPEVRTELDAELALQDNLRSLQEALRGERAFSVSYMTEQTGPILLRWPVLNWMLGELDAEDRACRIAESPVDQIRPRRDTVTKQIAPPQFAAIMSKLIGASLNAAFLSEFRRLTLGRCLRVVNALGEYRARNGKEAESIEQLSLPRDAVIDPWSDKPLLLRKTAAGWVVYSVWENGVNDGGRFDLYDGDWGLGPRGYTDAAK